MTTHTSSLPLYQVDAFTSQPFAGNPAAVIVLDRERDSEWMQSVAAEMNLSETAFVRTLGNGEYELRWMTPTVEVDLCGHATLATAHVLFSTGMAKDVVRFQSRSGILTTRAHGDKIELDFPAKPERPASPAPVELLRAIPSPAVYVGKNDFDYLVELESVDAVRSLEPNFARLKTLGVRGIVVTTAARAGADYDFVSRGFFPGSGIDEDPVTGSAHCMLAPYWQPRLGRSTLTGYQASARGGYVECEIKGNRVLLRGSAVTVLEGKLSV
jgi:PhzF family phenazine biosynthesis protein